ncbi:MAG: sulfurtransferase [Solimonas sp.]
MSHSLIQPSELAAHLGDAQWRIIDARFELSKPMQGRVDYDAGHLPGALYADLDADLSSPITASSGRHPLPTPEAFAETLSRWGIAEEVQVVVYDQGSGLFASRLWWLLRARGHRRVAVLDGGLAAWTRLGLPVTAAPSNAPKRAEVAARPFAGWLGSADVQRALANGAIVLVDARAADRFAGRNETIDPIAGHVPGARNHPLSDNLEADGRFLPAAELRKRWQARLAGRGANELVTMCGSGITACHSLLALDVAGLDGGRLYAGSWSEWIRDPARPVARDEA